MRDGGTVSYGRRGLVSLSFRDEAGSTFGGLQPACLALLLTGKAGQIMRLCVPAGVCDELFHPPMMRARIS
jgi:hypothetical protein